LVVRNVLAVCVCRFLLLFWEISKSISYLSISLSISLVIFAVLTFSSSSPSSLSSSGRRSFIFLCHKRLELVSENKIWVVVEGERRDSWDADLGDGGRGVGRELLGCVVWVGRWDSGG
jgi:hypothetical protein